MPRETTYFLCDFKCGQKAAANKEFMLTHEKRCWSNPANRSCKTCEHGEEIQEYDYGPSKHWECGIIKGEKRLEETAEIRGNMPGNTRECPVVMCHHWKGGWLHPWYQSKQFEWEGEMRRRSARLKREYDKANEDLANTGQLQESEDSDGLPF